MTSLKARDLEEEEAGAGSEGVCEGGGGVGLTEALSALKDILYLISSWLLSRVPKAQVRS